MNAENEHLLKVLKAQTFQDGSRELIDLQERKAAADKLLRQAFHGSAHIRYGGSYAKDTMIKEHYDLDVICFFERDDTRAGSSLQEIYNNVARALEPTYRLHRKTSAIRLVGFRSALADTDFHVDVVPGRYIDGSLGPVFLHQEGGSKERLKTDPVVHIEHIKNSGVLNALRLIKLWRCQNGVQLRQFVLDLAVIDILATWKLAPLNEQIRRVWTVLADCSGQVAVIDPANPEGNDLKPEWESHRAYLARVAQITLERLARDGMEAVFEIIRQDPADRSRLLAGAVASSLTRTKPWSNHG